MQTKKCFSRHDEKPIQISAWLMYLISKRFLKLRGVIVSFFLRSAYLLIFQILWKPTSESTLGFVKHSFHTEEDLVCALYNYPL